MARYGVVGSGPRIVVLLLLMLVLLLAGFIWFDFLGLINARDVLSPIYSIVGFGKRTRIETPESPDLLLRERLSKLQEALDLREQDLESREAALDERESQIDQKIDTLSQRERDLADREKSFIDRQKQDEIRSANLRVVSKNLTGMPPDKAIERLIEMDDQDIIDLLRTTDSIATEEGEFSLVAYWLSLMPADRAADINRKMLKKPGT